MRIVLSSFRKIAALIAGVLLLFACRHSTPPQTAFYYWKTNYELNPDRSELLSKAGNNKLYLRFFDIMWDARLQMVKPNALLQVSTPLNGVSVTPVIYITNQTLVQSTIHDMDSLAFKSARLISVMASKNHIKYSQVQIDCDWTDATRERYFAYLLAFKKYARCRLQVTIRLHQVKYRERTGVPPVDRGILMFYNVGRIGPGVQASSIYNDADAAKYLARLGSYPMQLDVALPVFSWAILNRGGKVIGLYSKVTRADLAANPKFAPAGKNSFKALNSFFFRGIYIKENDTFKLEETDPATLAAAAKQLSGKLAPLPDRVLIFYELSNIGPPAFTPEIFSSIADHF